MSTQEFLDLLPKPDNIPPEREPAVDVVREQCARMMRAIAQNTDPEAPMYTALLGAQMVIGRQLMEEVRNTAQVVKSGHVETEEEVNMRGRREAGKSSLIDDQMREASSFLTRD